ncbi:MAG: DUF6754 domain-containing protein [bacterium JZ-2024 1]
MRTRAEASRGNSRRNARILQATGLVCVLIAGAFVVGATDSQTSLWMQFKEWYPLYVRPERVNILGILGGFLLVFFTLLRRARQGEKMYLRKIAGLDAVNEAIGRATEMGKPILFINALGGPDEPSGIATVNILGLVAERVAQYETKLMVPNYNPVMFAVQQEVVKEAYIRAGKPDALEPDTVSYIAGTQFAYAAACSGLMVREKPATVLLMGRFYAESLILAETGAASGAIQIAGTDALTQLPFFVAACDYTLIGEELYAASAYLTGDPQLIGTLKTQDFGKAIAALTVIAGFIYTLIATKVFENPSLQDLVLRLLKTG